MSKPLGYWLKQIDRGIERNFAALLADEGLVRRSWQVLHTLADNPRTLEELDQAVAPFLDDTDPTVVPYLNRMIARSWVDRKETGEYALTDQGHAAHEALFERIKTQREAILDGLTPEDYDTLTALLRRIADNVETHAPQPN
ncbi:MarR family winged helix-turn-helix transcriptional regulator [Nocardia sp. NPDC003482]